MTGNRADALARLGVFVGERAVQARFPGGQPVPSDAAGGGPLVRGRFEWALGRRFLLQRTEIREIIEASRYLVLATADAAGRPWSTPVYFAHIGFAEFFWVSSPGVTHSRNIAVRPEVGIAVFDSQAAIGAGQGVYMSAVAELLDGRGADAGIEAFSRRSVAHGGPEWTSQDLRPGSGLRLYRAAAGAHWILAKDGQPDHRIPTASASNWRRPGPGAPYSRAAAGRL